MREQLAVELATELPSNKFEEKEKCLWIIQSFGGDLAGEILAEYFVDEEVGLEVLPIIAKIGGDESALILCGVLSPYNENSLMIVRVISSIGHIRAVEELTNKLFNGDLYPESIQEEMLSFFERKITADDKLKNTLTSVNHYSLMRLAGAYAERKITGAARIIARRIFEIALSPSASTKLAMFLCEPNVETEEIVIFAKSIAEYGDDDAAALLVENMLSGNYQNLSTTDVLTIAKKIGRDRTAIALLDLIEQSSEVKLRIMGVDQDEVLDLVLTIGESNTTLILLQDLIDNKEHFQLRRSRILELARRRGGSEIAKLLAVNIDSLSKNDEEFSQILNAISTVGDDEAGSLLIRGQFDEECSKNVLESVVSIAGDETSSSLLSAIEKKAINPSDLETVYSIVEEHGGVKSSSKCLTIISTNTVDDETKLRIWEIFKRIGDHRKSYYLADLFIEGSVSVIPPKEVLFFISEHCTRDALLLLAERINDSSYSNEYLEEVIYILLLYGDRPIFYILLRKSNQIPISKELALVIFNQYLNVADGSDGLHEMAILFADGLLKKIPLVIFLELFSANNLERLERTPECFFRLISGIKNKVFSEDETIMVVNKIIELRLQSYSIVSSALLGSIDKRSFSDLEFERVIIFISLLPPSTIDELPVTFYRATQLTSDQKKLLLLQIENRGGENTFVQLIYSYLALVQSQEISGYSGSIPDLALALDVIERRGGWSAMMALESIYLQGRGISDDERVMIRNSYRSMLMRGVGDKKPTGGLMRRAK